MGCLRLEYYEDFEPKRNNFLEELTFVETSIFSRSAYFFGFNGMEKDDEVSGNGNSYTAEFWQYDSRLGRRWNIDPIFKEHESPYACFANNPIWFGDPNGLDTFKMNNDGFVVRYGGESDVDVVFATNLDGSVNYNIDPLKLTNKSIIGNFTKEKKNWDKTNSTSSEDKEEMFKLFQFAADNTDVEWTIQGFLKNGKMECPVGTSHNVALSYCSTKTFSGSNSEFDMVFHIHSHPGVRNGHQGTKGGSQGDIKLITERYYRFIKVGMPNINVWFKRDGSDKYTKYPKHYVYHKQSKTLYHFHPWHSSIFIRNIKRSSDLYRGLGF